MPSKITITEQAILFEGPHEVWLGARRLVRGLRNEGGSYNCFLNVIIQALWHIASFRARLLALPPAAAAAAAPAAANGPSAASKGLQLVTAADCQVLQALRDVFQQLANSPGLPAEQQQQQQPSSSSSQYLVSPQALRQALSGLSELGAAAISIEHGEMHDASEVLNEMFTAMHRVEAGRATGIADDPHLPTKVKVRPELFAARKAPGAPAAAQQQQQAPSQQQQQQQPVTLAHILSMQNGVSSNGPAVNGGPKAASAAAAAAGSSILQKQPLSMVHRLFGLDVVQADAAAAAAAAAAKQKKAGSGAAATAAAAAGGGAKDAGSSQGLVEAMQFMKFCHLMPAQALRAAFDRNFDSSFEQVLQEAEAADHSSSSSSSAKGGSGSWGSVTHGKGGSGSVAAAGGASGTVTALLRRPAVFTLGMVWESPKAPLDSIRGAVQSLGPVLELSRAFGGLPAGAPYQLRSVICYFGHHYQAFVLSEELGAWLLFDDHVIQTVGDWQQVQAAMVANRLQPSLLFYEAADA
ncbi:hypothetical protein OEZ86_006645 [Tetradesmus obliquus]|nr:hypothetical protein OEZ86_006645 [Tetradesmus obliquus]